MVLNTISVIIPSTGRDSLFDAVKSVSVQSYLPLEVIICLDGVSISGTSLEQNILSLNFPKIIFITCPWTGGPAVPRNFGIENSKGEYVAFLDDDDTWHPNKLEIQSQLLLNKQYQACCSNAIVVSHSRGGSKYFEKTKSDLIDTQDLLQTNIVITSSVICKKQLLVDCGLFPTDQSFVGIEDYLTWAKVSFLGNFFFSSLLLVNYREVSQASLSEYRKNKLLNPQLVCSRYLIKWIISNQHISNVNVYKPLIAILRVVFDSIKNRSIIYLKRRRNS